MEYRDQLIYINEIIDANYTNIQNMIYNITNNFGNNDIEFRDDIIYNNEFSDFINFYYLLNLFQNLFI
jgi:hypothetical protein